MDTTFEDNYFGWANGVATYYTVYISGANNIVTGNCLEPGLASYVCGRAMRIILHRQSRGQRRLSDEAGIDNGTAPTTTAAPTTTEAPTTTVAPTTTAAPTTTVAPTTTAAPTTTVAPTTTAAPNTTVAPTTTAAPNTTAPHHHGRKFASAPFGLGD